MESSNNLSRRRLLAGAAGLAGAAALSPLTSAMAFAQAAGGDWFAMVKAEHAAINAQFNYIIENVVYPGPQRVAALAKLAALSTAHFVAEENVIYPAIALNKEWVPSEELYLEQDHFKIYTAELSNDLSEGSIWIEKVKELQAIVLVHAKEHEEENYFLKLHTQSTAEENATLTASYAKFYDMVQPPA